MLPHPLDPSVPEPDERVRARRPLLRVVRDDDDGSPLVRQAAEKRLELEAVCKDLNEMYGRYAELKARYDEIMAYWKQQRRRGYITPEEYEELSRMFLGNRPV